MFYIYADGKMIYNLANPELYLNQPKLTLEIGKAGSLEFGIMPDHAYYDRLSQLSTIVTVDYDDTEIFRGRVLSNTRDFQNMRKVYCEGDLAYLVDTVQKFSKYNGTVHDLFRKIIADHNARIKDASKQFTVGNITVENRSVKLTGQDDDDINVGNIDYKQIAINSIVDEWNTTFDIIQTCIIDYVGGYLNTRRQNGVTYIDLLTAPSDMDANTTTQTIELGVNMLDLEEEITAEDLFTVLIPLGDDNLTIKSVNNGSDELVDTNAVNRYGRIIKTHVFNNVNEASTLLENGRRYLESNINIPTTLTINALDMHIVNKDYDPIHLCDKVHIRSTRHSIVEYLTCTKIEYDLENPANDTYTFGNPTQTLTQRYREDKRKEADTYGNSASGGHGGGGGAAADAAEAAAAEALEEAADELESFYNAYIDVDPSHGKITLGTVYNETVHMITTLAECGISMESNPEHANINIQTLYNTTIDNTADIVRNSTNISSLSDALGSEINIRASAIDGLNDSVAAIRLKANANGNAIVDIDADIVNINGKISAIEADLVDAAKLKARIAALDTVTVNGTLSAAGGLRASSITLGNNEPVYSYMHYHSLSAEDGVVKLGPATTTGPTSFSIADTQFFKDRVSAAKTAGAESAILSSLSVGSAGSPYDYNNTKYADVTVSYTVAATRGDGTLYTDPDSKVKAVDVSSVYNAVTISSIALNGSPGYTYQTANRRYAVSVKATAANGNYSNSTLYVPATDAYDAGVTAGENKFEAVSVNLLGSAVYRYEGGGTASGTNLGSAYPNALYVDNGSGGYRRLYITLYYTGTDYSYNLRGSGGYYYNSGGSATYYRKK